MSASTGKNQDIQGLGLEEAGTEVARSLRARRKSPPPIEASLGVIWEGSQFITHSLAIVNRELCSRLIARGVDLGLVLYEEHTFAAGSDPQLLSLEKRFHKSPQHSTRVHVRHQWPPNFERPRQGKWVLIQPWEYGFIPQQWLKPLRDEVDEIWVPSRYARQCYIDSGVPCKKIVVIPNGVDTKRFHPKATPAILETKKRFKFLFVGGTIPRKGIRLLLDTYRRYFKRCDDVCLVIKDMGGKGVYQGSTNEDEIRTMMADPDAPEIEYIDEHIPHEQVAGLYTAADVLVHAYHGEGFGIPIAESMACGVPVIVTGLGAAMDFCNQQNSYLIPATRHDMPTMKVSDMDACGYPWLANPDGDALGLLMREAVTNPARHLALGREARKTIISEFTWDHAVDMVWTRLRALGHSEDTVRGKIDSVSSSSGMSPNPEFSGVEGEQIESYLRLAGSLRKEGRVDEACELALLALSEDPENDEALVLLRELSEEVGFDIAASPLSSGVRDDS